VEGLSRVAGGTRRATHDPERRAARLKRTVSQLVPLEWWRSLERRGDALSNEASLRLATALVQDGVTRVTLVLPRAPGTLARARAVAEKAGVDVRAADIGSKTMTLRFSASPQRQRR
jgi:hypothetical protein